MTKRTYSEEEVAEIIRRAAEMETGQMRERDKAGSLPGLDLEELSKVAADAGHSWRRVASGAAGVSTRWCVHLRASPIRWWVSGGCVR